MKFESIPSGKGDCFLITWTVQETPHCILIDSGTPGIYKTLRPKLKEIGVLDAIFLTHIDFDHIGGMIRLLEDESNAGFGYSVYLNTPQLFHVAGSDKGVVGYGHGTDLGSLLQKLNVPTYNLYLGLYPEDTIEIGKMIIKILSPSKQIVDALLDEWTATTVYDDYFKSRTSLGMVGRPLQQMLSFSKILTQKEEIYPWQNDLLNSSSIAFLLRLGERKILMLGDANPDVLSLELSNLGYSSKLPLCIDMCKLSHHGSKHNTSKELLSLICCNTFYISTDGTGNNYHPDRETLARIAVCANRNDSNGGIIRIITNYDIDFSNIINEQELIDYKLELIHQPIIEFN